MSIFYKITSPKGKSNYLFGSIHMSNFTPSDLPPEIRGAYANASHYVFEADITNIFLLPKRQAVLLKEWKDAQEHLVHNIPETYLTRARKIYLDLCTPLPETMTPDDKALASEMREYYFKEIHLMPPLQFLQPQTVADSNKSTPEELFYLLDSSLICDVAKNKPISYLETLDEELTALHGYQLNILEQIEIFNFLTSEHSKQHRPLDFKSMLYLYLQQNIAAITNTSKDIYLNPNTPEPVLKYFNGIWSERDTLMAERMRVHLDKGDTFVTVGAGHLKGITDILQTNGYLVEEIPVTFAPSTLAYIDKYEQEQKIIAFNTVYRALYAAQTSFFKQKKFMADESKNFSVDDIIAYADSNKKSRTAKAWELSQKFQDSISSSNKELLKEICQAGYAKSSVLGLFKRTKTNLDDAQSVANASSETRTGQVRDLLHTF